MKKLKQVLSVLFVAILVISGLSIDVHAATTLKSSEIAAYFNDKVGSSYPSGMCLAFVADCFQNMGATRSSTCCAYNYGNSYIMSTDAQNIPIGADVFFGACGGGPCSSCGSSYYGHIGVYVGDGYFVHATGGIVQKSTLSSWSSKYRGWGYHGNVSVVDDLSVVPSGPQISKNQYWYDREDTVTLNCYADGATKYHIVIDDNWGLRLVDEDITGSSYSFPANRYDEGTYWACMIASNSSGSVQSEWIEIPLVGEAGYTDLYTDRQWYDLQDTIIFNVDTVCAKGQVIGIDNIDSYERVYTENVPNPFQLSAQTLGVGNYSAYYSVYNGSGGIDTTRINFSIYGAPDKELTPVLNKDIYKLDENIVISLDEEGTGIENRVIGIDKVGKGRVYTENVTNPFEIPASDLGVGEYSVYYSVYNDCGVIDTNRISFKIIEREAPSNLQVVVEKTELNIDDSLTALASADGGVDYYKIQIWNGSEFVRSEEFTGHEYILACSELGVGEFACYVTAVNDVGTITSETYAFSIKEIPDVVKTGHSGDTIWSLADDGKLTFSGEGAMKNYAAKTAMPWYEYINQIESVVIGDGVTSIGNYAFYGMPNLTEIYIPETVKTIGDYAFKGCTSLDGVVLPLGLTQLGESAFYGCTSLSAIDIPASLYTVKPYTFKNCTSLAEVTFHEGNLMKLSDGAFYGTAVTEISIPDCATIVDVYCFKNCTKLESVKLSSSMTEIREAAFYGTALTTLEVPKGVTKIGPYAFKNCKSLTTVSLPSTLTSIGEASFYACDTLKEVVLPDAVTEIGNYAFRKCESLTNVQFSESLENIGESAFYGCIGLTSLDIPEGVTVIGGYAFKSCTGLVSVELPDSLTTLGESAFYGCTGLTTITIPENVETIGDYAFSRCINLKEIEFCGDAPSIGSNAFAKVIADVYYPAGNITWTADVMRNYGGTINWKEN